MHDVEEFKLYSGDDGNQGNNMIVDRSHCTNK